MKRVKLYNLIFPIWLAVWFTPYVLLILLGNLMLDATIVWALIRFFEGKAYRIKISLIFKIWFIGFVADFIGAFYLIILDGSNKYWIYDPLGTKFDFICTMSGVLLTAILIFIFDFFITKSYDLSRKTRILLSTFMAILTAPYTFLIPTDIFGDYFSSGIFIIHKVFV